VLSRKCHALLAIGADGGNISGGPHSPGWSKGARADLWHFDVVMLAEKAARRIGGRERIGIGERDREAPHDVVECPRSLPRQHLHQANFA
jgi:hypothetical protein